MTQDESLHQIQWQLTDLRTTISHGRSDLFWQNWNLKIFKGWNIDGDVIIMNVSCTFPEQAQLCVMITKYCMWTLMAWTVFVACVYYDERKNIKKICRFSKIKKIVWKKKETSPQWIVANSHVLHHWPTYSFVSTTASWTASQKVANHFE